MKKPVEVFYVDCRDFVRQVAGLCCDTPIKFRQVFVPLMTGVMDRTITLLGMLRLGKMNDGKEEYRRIAQALSEWQIILEMMLDLRAVKDVRIAPLLAQSEKLKKTLGAL